MPAFGEGGGTVAAGAGAVGPGQSANDNGEDCAGDDGQLGSSGSQAGTLGAAVSEPAGSTVTIRLPLSIPDVDSAGLDPVGMRGQLSPKLPAESVLVAAGWDAAGGTVPANGGAGKRRDGSFPFAGPVVQADPPSKAGAAAGGAVAGFVAGSALVGVDPTIISLLRRKWS